MISPLEIQEKEFGRGLKGYKEDEVNDFLNRIILDLEKLLEENNNLRVEHQKMAAELSKYKGDEGSVLETLETAKALMGDISSSAEKRAEILLKNAELDAQLIQREAKESVDRLMEENATMQTRVTEFRKKYKELLESELQRFDTLETDLFLELGMKDPDDVALPQTPLRDTQVATQVQPQVPLRETQPTPQIQPQARPQPQVQPTQQEPAAEPAPGPATANDRKKTMINLK